MSLRSAASAHLARILSDPNGAGEPLVYRSASGAAVSLVGTWNENPSDGRNQIGTGIESTHSGATCRIRVADVPALDEAGTITRSATGEVWQIEQHELSIGVAWILRLAKRSENSVRGGL